ncbi:MAG TPA: anti-sigma factor [Frankiaceae bacterium]|nr:anti-sigma factor [Frankiaceae bacterium]
MTAGHAAWDELAAGYAVNALEPEEEHAFVGHLRGCDRCRDTLAELEQVTGQLAYAAEPATPPAELGRRILDAAAAERPAVFGKTPPMIAAVGSDRAPRQRRPGRVWQPTFRAATLATAAAVLVVLGLGGWNFVLRGDSRAKEIALERRDKALTCLASPEGRRFVMSSPGGQRATSCLSDGRAYLVVDRLEANDRDSSVYVLWWLDGQGQPKPVERFDVAAAGTAVYELPIEASEGDVAAMAVSLEQGRALPKVPSRVVLSGEAARA